MQQHEAQQQLGCGVFWCGGLLQAMDVICEGVVIGMPVEDAIEECAGAWLFQQSDFESCGVLPGVVVNGAAEFVSGRGAGGAVSAGAGEQQCEQAGCAEAEER
ncbi:MAG: hypothetical protein ACKON9_04390, partial [Planctomycetaceae bacterium]